MRILYVMPHASTGGQPSYVFKLIEELKDKFDILVAEMAFYGPDYVVQRNKIKALVPFYDLHGRQDKLLKLIEDEKPNIVHLHEVPESFIDKAILAKIYSPERKYSVVVTSHSSRTTRKDFTYVPDRLVAVCEWQQQFFQKEFPDTIVDLWKYPIEDRIPTPEEKLKARKKLRMKDNYNVVSVGLFTPGKNQGELFEIARKNPDITYHFVGNQAQNFSNYWMPLMKDKPTNCVIWGERSDVDTFYKAADALYFNSIFELFPLVPREALSYGLPIKMRQLPTYGSEYLNNPLITFIK